MATRFEVTFFQVKFQERELDFVISWSHNSPCALYVSGIRLRKVWTADCYTGPRVFYGHFPINISCVIPTSSTRYNSTKKWRSFIGVLLSQFSKIVAHLARAYIEVT